MTSLRNEKLEFAQLAVIDCNYSQVTGSYASDSRHRLTEKIACYRPKVVGGGAASYV